LPDAVCPDCGTEVAPGLLACPSCRRLVYSEELKKLAAQAERAEKAGDAVAAMGAWRDALTYLPSDSKQYVVISARISGLAPGSSAAKSKHPSAVARGAAGAGALGLFLWKFKIVIAFILTKGKLLLLGLTKMSTLVSMFTAFGVYWSLWGWKFAGGFIVSMYIHEMGHVAKLHAYGIRADAPMFIPGLGAFVRLRQYPANPVENARVGLAGPLWGLGASIAAYIAFFATGAPIWAGIGKTGAVLNLFNMIPVWQLDGSRGFGSLTRSQRWVATTAVGAALLFLSEGSLTLLLLAILVCALYRSIIAEPVEKPDLVGLLQYVVLIAALTFLAMMPVRGFEGLIPQVNPTGGMGVE